MLMNRLVGPGSGLTSIVSVLGPLVPTSLFEPTLARIEAAYAGPPFRVRLWDGTERRFGAGAPTFTLGFETPTALVRSLLQGSLGFGESYASGDLTIDGDLEDVLAALMPLYLAMPPQGPLEAWLKRTVARSLPQERHQSDRSREPGKGCRAEAWARRETAAGAWRPICSDVD